MIPQNIMWVDRWQEAPYEKLVQELLNSILIPLIMLIFLRKMI